MDMDKNMDMDMDMDAASPARMAQPSADAATRTAASDAASDVGMGIARADAMPMPTSPDDADASVGSKDGSQATPAMTEIDTTCSADAECRAVDVTCQTCRCVALKVGVARPACNQPPVSCIVAPCRYKRAVCRNQACSLVDESPGSI